MTSKETNFSCYVKLIMTPLLSKLTKEEKMLDNPHSLQELDVFSPKNSRQELCHVSRNNFRRASYLEARGQQIGRAHV